MSGRAAKDAEGRGTRKVGDVMKYCLDLTRLHGMENFQLSPVC